MIEKPDSLSELSVHVTVTGTVFPIDCRGAEAETADGEEGTDEAAAKTENDWKKKTEAINQKPCSRDCRV